MPELPEVENVARQLAAHIDGLNLKHVEIFDKARLALPHANRLAGRKVRETKRYGKEVLIVFAAAANQAAPDLGLLIHLRMTGKLIWRSDRELKEVENPFDRPPRARLVFNGGEVWFMDVRRFGTFKLMDPAPVENHESDEKGADSAPAAPWVDPTSDAFTAKRFVELLKDSRQPIKPWLLRQDRLVGVGNIYASEACFGAKILPTRAAGSLKPAEIARLRESLREVLDRATKLGGSTVDNYSDTKGKRGRYQRRLRVYKREGKACFRCNGTIERLVQAGRSTFFCAGCQK